MKKKIKNKGLDEDRSCNAATNSAHNRGISATFTQLQLSAPAVPEHSPTGVSLMCHN
jgi:hypothetical protein